MSAGDVSAFLSRLVVHFGEPKFDVAEGERAEAHKQWLRDMVRSLKDANAEVLDRAAGLIIDRRKYRSFPLLSDIRDACEAAAEDIKRERPRLIGHQPVQHGSTIEDRENFARDLLLGAMGRQAAREGWIFGLFTFARDHMRLPSATAHCGDKRKMHRDHGPCSEVECIKRGSEGVMTALEALYRNHQDILPSKRAEWEEQRKGLISIGEKMLAKREALTKYVETGVLP